MANESQGDQPASPTYEFLKGGRMDGRVIKDPDGLAYAEVDSKGGMMCYDALDGAPTKLPFDSIEDITIEKGIMTVTAASGWAGRYAGRDDGEKYSIAEPVPIPTFSGQLNEFMIFADYYARDYRDSLRFDVLHERVLADISTWDKTQNGYVPIAGVNEIDAYAMILDRLPKGEFESSGRARIMKHPIEQFRQYSFSRAWRKPYNAFVDEWRAPPSQGADIPERYDPAKFFERCGATCPDPDMDPEDRKALVDGASLTTILTVVGRMVEKDGAPGEIGVLLYGQPGSGKSSITRALALGSGDDPGPYHKELGDYPSREMDLYYSTRGKVIVELQEGAGLTSRATFNKLKGDITRHHFSFAGKWEVYSNDHPKRYTEIITTNNYREVPEDNRRICPLEVIAPSDATRHAYRFPTDDMRAMYHNALQSYNKGDRAGDVYQDIRNLVDRARRFVVQVPDAWSDIEDFASEYMTAPGHMASRNEIKSYLREAKANTVPEVEAAMSWLDGHGFKDLGWERLNPTDNPRDTRVGSYAYSIMGKKKMRMSYRVPRSEH